MKPLIQIVNNLDDVIGHKHRDKIDPKSDIYRVSAIWVTNSLGQALIAQRKLTKKSDPGKWGPAVAGTLDEGETYVENAYKEAEEEIGLTGITFQEGPKQRFIEPRHFFCQWFTAQLDREEGEFVIQDDEVEKVKWVDVNYLATDVEQHPEVYIGTMQSVVETFINVEVSNES